MKVTGPGTGAPGAAPDADKGPGAADAVNDKKAGGAERTGKAEGAGRSFAETLAAGRSAPAGATSPGRSTGPVGGVDALTDDIAAELKAGKIDPKAALDKVVERVLDRQLGANAPVALRAELRSTLCDTISSDPLLAERLRGLG